MRAQEIQTKCTTLRQFWAVRNTQFKVWLDILLLVDLLKKENLETVVANDPRTFYNMSKRILTPKPMIHRIPIAQLEKPEIARTSEVEVHLSQCWKDNNTRYRRRGKLSWWDEFLGLLMLTGWYSVFGHVTKDEAIAEIWHPAQVFPRWGERGLDECAHIFTLSALEANRIVRQKGWVVKQPFRQKTTLHDLWEIDTDGDVAHAIALGDSTVVDYGKEPGYDEIPIFIAPTGGVPDMGVIKESDDWKKFIGQSIFATNERVYADNNKHNSFQAQLLRDTAQSRWVEKTRGEGVLTPENIFQRGGIYKITPEEDIYAMPVPVIPVELRAQQLSFEGQIQRGSLSHLLFGSIVERVTAYTMSQVAESAHQVLDPFHQATQNAVTDLDNFWLKQEEKHNFHPYGFERPEGLPENLEVEATYRISIPGDFIQRATTARMMSPEIEFSQETTMDLLFPEITNPLEEIAKASKGKAMTHPVAKLIDLIAGFEEQANFLMELGDMEGAKLFNQAAQQFRKQLAGATAPEAETGDIPRREPPGIGPQAMPPTEPRAEV